VLALNLSGFNGLKLTNLNRVKRTRFQDCLVLLTLQIKVDKKGATFVRKATIGETLKTFSNNDVCIGASIRFHFCGKAVYLQLRMVIHWIALTVGNFLSYSKRSLTAQSHWLQMQPELNEHRSPVLKLFHFHYLRSMRNAA
jgi:hypothetical protein